MQSASLKTASLAFVAGALGVIVFHQGFIFILYLLHLVPIAPYSFRPTSPLYVPQVLSQSFWGGIWGICMIFAMERIRGANHLWLAFLFGGILLPLVAIVIVTPLKGGNIADWLTLQRLFFAFVINAVWGLGAALLYRIGRQRLSHSARTASTR
jgi:hypothetical protein